MRRSEPGLLLIRPSSTNSACRCSDFILTVRSAGPTVQSRPFALRVGFHVNINRVARCVLFLLIAGGAVACATANPPAAVAVMPDVQELGAADTHGTQAGTGTSNDASYATGGQQAGDVAIAEDVTGVWEGTSARSGPLFGGHAVRKIMLTLIQRNNEVTGFYRCAYGNQLCPGIIDDKGTVCNGSMIGRNLRMRVTMPDGMSCLFDGVPTGDRLLGGYICLQGAGLVEKGQWQTERSY
jgi:hypothetical protein